MSNSLVSIQKKDLLGKLFLLFSIGLAFIMTREILNGQYIQSGDSFWHYSNELNLIKSIENGKGIFACLDKGIGLPLSVCYQPLLYIMTVAVYFCFAKIISIFFIHNLFICLLFSLFPLSIYYFARSFRFSVFVSGLASLFSLVPVSGWGHTIDAYFWIGLHTQLLGALFLPVVLGSIHRLTWSKHINRTIVTAVLSSSGLLMGHAVYAVLAVYAGLVYLPVFLIWRGWRTFFNLLKPLLLVAVCVTALVSFWLIPFLRFNAEYKFIPESERSFSPLAVSLTVKDTLEAFAAGTLLDTNNLNSPLFGGGEEGFRWSVNDSFYRFKLFTILTILGFLISFFIRIKFRHFFICSLMTAGLFLFCGKDDFPILHILPFAKNFQPIRAIFLIEISAMILSATAIERIFSFFNRLKIPVVIKSILLILSILLLAPLLVERVCMANIIIKSAVTSDQKELAHLYSKIKNKDKFSRIYLGKYTGIRKISLRSLADCFYLNNAVGHDNDMAGSVSWLINDVQKNIPASSHLSNLLGIKYLVKKKNWSFPEKENVYENFFTIDTSSNYEILSNKNEPKFFSFADKKPILVWCDNKTWYYLNRLWINLFLEHRDKLVPLVKAPKIFPHLLGEKLFCGIVLINFPLSKKNKNNYLTKFHKINSQGIKIFSNKPLWDVQVEKLIPSRTKIFTDFLLRGNSYTENSSLKHIKTGFNEYTVTAYTDTDKLLIGKTAYYDNWQISVDGKKQNTFWVSPGLIGCFIPAGNHDASFSYLPSLTHSLLLCLGIFFIIALILVFEKSSIKFSRKSLIKIFHFSGLSFYRNFNRIILVVVIGILLLSYGKMSFFKSVSLIYPYNKIKGLNPYEVVFRWNRINQGEQYFFQLADGKNSFGNPLFHVDDIAETSVGYRGLKPYKTYYWRVKPDNGSWSDIYTFKTGGYFP